jgi:hypothetical protein
MNNGYSDDDGGKGECIILGHAIYWHIFREFFGCLLKG